MAYNPIPWLPAFKDFDWYPGDKQEVNLSLNRELLDGDTYRCYASSRYTGAKYEFEVTQEGSNAGYLGIHIPALENEPSGFTYQVYRYVGNAQGTGSVVASGIIFSRTEKPSIAS